ncbi:MAG: hypothetical protein ACRD0U_11110, partial [Acidimicrobiales bacterium]
MAASVRLEPTTVTVAPGGEATVTLTVENTGAVVDAFTVDVVGTPAPWAAIDPREVRLFPGAGGSATIRFRPSADAPPSAGSHDFGVRVRSSEDPGWSTVEEGRVDVSPIVELAAEIRPQTSSGRHAGRHRVTVENRGNVAVRVSLAPDDPDDLLGFKVTPPEEYIPPGQGFEFKVRAEMIRRPPQGTNRVPFLAGVLADGRPAATVNATFAPRKLIGGGLSSAIGIGAVVAAVMLVIGFAVIRPIVLAGETESGAGDRTTTTTTAEPTTTTAGGGDTTTTAGGGETTTIVEQTTTTEDGRPSLCDVPPRILVFSAPGDRGFIEVFVSFDGDEPESLTGDLDGDAADPSLSADGEQVAFVSNAEGSEDIFVANVDGSDLRNLTRSPDSDERQPDWLPDGRQVLAQQARVGFSGQPIVDLVLLDVVSGRVVTTLNVAEVEGRPAVSPDGTRFGFEEDRSAGDVRVNDFAGRQKTGVATSAAAEGFPAWFDDDRVMFRSADRAGDASFELLVAPADGGDAVALLPPDEGMTPVA